MNQKHKETILMVDDSPMYRKVIEVLFGHEHDVILAKSGQEALEVVKTQVPSLVLLDIMMPGLNGYEVCRQLREIPDLKMTKILLVSGKKEIEERLEGYQAGADDYVVKPFDNEELIAKVGVFLRLVRVERELAKVIGSLEEEVQKRVDQLMDSKRLAYIGMHASQIVHNLKSPVSIIRGYCRHLLKKDSENAALLSIDRANNQILETVKSILESIGKAPKKMDQNVDLNVVLSRELEVVKIDSFFKYDVESEVLLSDLPRFRSEGTDFSQVFGNLIKNAIESMYNSEKKILRVSSGWDGTHIEIRISDTGHGISEEIRDQIFDALFTTKLGEHENEPIGTGLGLPFCKKVIESYGGELLIESQVGEGTTFLVRLPASDAV